MGPRGGGGSQFGAGLPNPVDFEAATASITEDDMREVFGCGPDPEESFDFFASEPAGHLRNLVPSA